MTIWWWYAALESWARPWPTCWRCLPPFPAPPTMQAAAGAPATMLCHPLAPSVRAALQPQWRCGPGVSRRCVVSSEGCGCSQSPLAVTADSKQPTYIGFDLQPNRIQVTGGGVVQPGAFRCNAVTRPGSCVRHVSRFWDHDDRPFTCSRNHGSNATTAPGSNGAEFNASKRL